MLDIDIKNIPTIFKDKNFSDEGRESRSLEFEYNILEGITYAWS